MRVYISGRITGLPFQDVQTTFRATAFDLQRKGHEAINPLDIAVEKCADIGACRAEDSGHVWSCWMKADIREMMHCDAVLALGNWQDSRGARIEVGLADSLEIPVYYQDLNNDLPIPSA
jgi:nucleoside 2-deoxyribosyltransferase